MKVIFTLLTCLLFYSTSQSQALIGGYLQRERPLPGDGNSFTYRFVGSLLGDAGTRPSSFPAQITFDIYRKRDDRKINSVNVSQGTVTTLSTFAFCSNELVLYNEAVYRFSIDFNPAVYNDAGGYYIVSSPACCRGSGVANIANAGSSPIVLYFEITSDAIKAVPMDYISVVGVPDKSFLCVSEANTVSIILTTEPLGAPAPPAFDKKCRLITPLTSGSKPYQDINWASGYSLSNPVDITGSLNIAQSTSELKLTLTPTKLGTYHYGVVYEEYRNGVKYFEQRYEYQMLVKICERLPIPTITATKPKTTTPSITPEFCEGDSIQLNAQSSRKGVKYQWKFNGVDIPKATDSVYIAKAAGDYYVLTSDARVCAPPTLAQVTVKMNPKPTVTIASTSSGGGGCQAATVQLSTNTNGNGLKYQWSKDNTDINGATNPILDVTASGDYTVKVTSDKGCSATSKTEKVTLSGLPSPTVVSVNGKTALCPGSTLALSATTGAGLTYQWIFDGITLGATQPTYTAKSGGGYAVKITNTAGCSATSPTLNITLTQSVPPTLTTSSTGICPGNSIQLTTNTGAMSYEWFRDNVKIANASTATYTTTQGGTYLVQVVDMYGCTMQSTNLVLTNVPTPTVNAGNDVSIEVGKSVPLSATTSAAIGATYAWAPPAGLDKINVLNPTSTPLLTTTYKLTVTTKEGCTASDDVTITVTFPTIEIPNAFSPNEDGVNDTWTIRGIEAYPECSVEIYNRWGSKVFASQGYTLPWDGRKDSQLMPVATYYYVIKLGVDNQAFNGTLTIIK